MTSHTTTLTVFDFDGVIVDSRETVRNAYRKVGIEMPDDAWGKAWYEWLPELMGGDRAAAHKAHMAKNRRMLETPPTFLGGAEMFRGLITNGQRVGVLSGASMTPISSAMSQLGVWPEFIISGATTARKARALRYLSDCGDFVTYVDDDEHRGRNAIAESGAPIIFVHYKKEND